MPVANPLAEEISYAMTDQELRELQAKNEKLRTAVMARLAEALGRPGFQFRRMGEVDGGNR